MKKMKTLTVGADTYQVWDPEAARIDDSAVTEDAWSSKNIVDMLCPGFEQVGSAVVCSPVEGYPLEVVTDITGVQLGSGTPTPENICPLSGWAGANLRLSGKNLLDITALTNGTTENVESVQKSTNAITITSSAQGRTQWHGRFAVPRSLWGKTLTLSCGGWSCTDSTANSRCFALQQITAAQGAGEHAIDLNQRNSVTFTVKENVTYLMILFRVDQEPPYSPAGTVFTVEDVQLELAESATAFEPFRKSEILTTNFGKTVYSGSYDWNTGILTVSHELLTFTGTEKLISYNNEIAFEVSRPTHQNINAIQCLCSHYQATDQYATLKNASTPGYRGVSLNDKLLRFVDNVSFPNGDAEGMKAYFAEQYANGTPVQVAYPLEEPVTIILEPQAIHAQSGINVLFSDTGDTTVAGKADPTAVIDKLGNRIAALEAAIVNYT